MPGPGVWCSSAGLGGLELLPGSVAWFMFPGPLPKGQSRVSLPGGVRSPSDRSSLYGSV